MKRVKREKKPESAEDLFALELADADGRAKPWAMEEREIGFDDSVADRPAALLTLFLLRLIDDASLPLSDSDGKSDFTSRREYSEVEPPVDLSSLEPAAESHARMSVDLFDVATVAVRLSVPND